MSRRAAVIGSIAWCFLVAAAPVSGQPTAPATLPPTAPATPPAAPAAASVPTTTSTAPATTAAAHDFSTPKASVRSLAVAMQSGDKAVILAALHANNPTETRLAKVMADLSEAMAALSRSAVAAFGEEGARPITGESSEGAEALARLDAATVKEEGDSASIGTGPSDPTVTLVRVDGKWKLPVSAIIAGVDEAAIAQRLVDVEAQVGLFNELASEVKQGKYKTGEEVRQALDQRILQMVMQQKPRPTTTTAPAPPAPPP